jgi:very-short-patch-repair endonuclease
MAGIVLGHAAESDECCINHAIRGKRSTREADRVLSELAERQHGVVARWQLLGAGVSRRTIDRWMGRSLHPIHRGAYAVGYPISRTESRWMAAVLTAGPDAVLSHRTAAQLWRLVPRSSHRLEVTRPAYLRPGRHIHGHRLVLPEDERGVVDGVPVTSAPRTIFDLAAVVPRRQVERALQEMEVQQLIDRLSISDLLRRYPRRRGSAVLSALLDERITDQGITQNDFEELFVSLLDSSGLPRPRFNADLAVAGRFFSADCLWMKERLIVELDGRAVHGTREAFEEDRERDRVLMSGGWRVIRITWRQLRDQQSSIASDIHRALAQGRALH